MYKVNSKEFKYFSKALKFAKEFGFDVFQADNGMRRWTPGTINAKSAAMYKERQAAYAAQQKAAVS